MNYKALVLGCGMVGKTMARDLAQDDAFEVSVADISEKNLALIGGESRIRTIPCDLGNQADLSKLVAEADVVVGAMPSKLGFATLKTVIEAGKPISDISFMPEDALELDELAKSKGVTAVVDCGVSPGLSNLFVGHAYARLDETREAVIYVGGLPKMRRWPFQYKAPFAPSDVLEEYTRPARFLRNGILMVRPALTDAELIDFPRIGTLEAFNTDGLRTLLTTVNIPDMREKTLRYPGHIETMRIFRETGFFRADEINVKGQKVRPLDVTSTLMFEKWAFEPNEEEFTILRVVVEGILDGKPRRCTYDLFDEYDAATRTQSMARTTGFPNTIMARMLARGEFVNPGINPPERFADREAVVKKLLTELNRRGVHVHIDGP